MYIKKFSKLITGLLMSSAAFAAAGPGPAPSIALPPPGFTLAKLADVVEATPTATVWSTLTSTGYGACRVAAGGASTACYYYFKVGVADSCGMKGAPVYNTANSNGGRQIPIGATACSTGCFPNAGYGPKSGNAASWGGNDPSEPGMDGKEYAKALLVQLLRGSGDPCQLASVISTSAGGHQAVEALTSNANVVYKFADGKPLPDQCYNVVSEANGSPKTVPQCSITAGSCSAGGPTSPVPLYVQLRPKTCRHILARKLSQNNVANQASAEAMQVAAANASGQIKAGLSDLNAKVNATEVNAYAAVDKASVLTGGASINQKAFYDVLAPAARSSNVTGIASIVGGVPTQMSVNGGPMQAISIQNNFQN